MKLNENIKKLALQHAKDESPRESVGLVHIVKGKEKYYKCNNLAEIPDEHFVLDPEDYIKAENKGEITAIIHSHPTTHHNPSPADLVACEKSGLHWFIVNPKTELWGSCKPSGYELPYVGRSFFHGVVDCYTLVRDFYKKEFAIHLNDYFRKDKWWDKGENMYLDNFKNEGFYEIPLKEIQYGCVVLMNIESNVPNHAAIYLEDNIVLHHVQGRLSSRDVYGGYYITNTAKVLKHENN
nr:putative phage cell-wall peptidase [uncultured Mediterranean phage uvMED]BAR26589.1 putative phage cell-wall peptidase [uncultured Mediterranean phage uvMED]BAR26616.1 putative phage cell-wall peptidase [uncultured Mediterranean phage uvMED]BAR26670.1 putative phage cell-wall peptidase [uncultured Mediterranean phage uvMED]BAR26740.1 putative phage cell-wall peptidase [uncultured Mediterranean phage uvMED]|tara:strand:+ start:1396 stop:2109 length:714 start_codon:yes stop_codon:yes gene_type:complete